MAKMKSPRERIQLMALKEAADETAMPEMPTKIEEEMCSCPKCGYEGPELEFKTEE
jgi:hypothetical protein